MDPRLHDHSQNPPLLEVEGLSVSFSQYESGLRRRDLRVIHELSLDVHAGEILAIAGSSGSGKSLFAHAVLGLLPGNARVEGTLRYKGEDLTPERQEKLRGAELGFVPQSVNFLDPLMRVDDQVASGLEAEHRAKGAPSDPTSIRSAVRGVFQRLGLDASAARKYPFQLSGGMARRVLVSSAMIGGASLIIADEPTPGLDPALAKETMQALRQLADEGRGVVLITHDIDLAFDVADRIAVFYAGTALEVAPIADFAHDHTLRHPYTKALWHALPQNGFAPFPGFQPYALDLPQGCVFGPRCPHQTRDCVSHAPRMRKVRDAWVRCCHAT